MRTKALVSLLLTVVSIPVLPQQPQAQKLKPTAPGRQQPETEEDQDSVVRISTNLAVKDAASAKVGNAAQLVEVPRLDLNRVSLSGITLSTDPEAGPISIANVAMRRFR